MKIEEAKGLTELEKTMLKYLAEENF